MLGDVLVRLHCKRCLSALGFLVVLVVPCADRGVEACASFAGIGVALFGGGVGADEGGEIDGGEAFGC